MQQYEIKKFLKKLKENEYLNYITYCGKINMVYIEYNSDIYSLYDAYIKSNQIATQFNVEVVFAFINGNILVNENTTMENVKKQYKEQSRIVFEADIQSEFEEYLNSFSINNIFELLDKNNWKSDYISEYQLRKLSYLLYNKYKIKQSDLYLDNKVEDAKVLIKK